MLKSDLLSFCSLLHHCQFSGFFSGEHRSLSEHHWASLKQKLWLRMWASCVFWQNVLLKKIFQQLFQHGKEKVLLFLASKLLEKEGIQATWMSNNCWLSKEITTSLLSFTLPRIPKQNPLRYQVTEVSKQHGDWGHPVSLQTTPGWVKCPSSGG